MDTPIDVDEDNQWKHDSEFVKIIKNMYGTCFISNFSRDIDWNGLKYVRGLQVMHIDISNINQARQSPKSGYIMF